MYEKTRGKEMNTDQEENLDLLDLESEGSDSLPEAAPFSSPRPKRPWLLMGLGLAIIALASWIIIAHVVDDSGTTVSVDLDTPTTSVNLPPAPMPDLRVPPKPVDVVPQPMERPQPVPMERPVPMEQPQPVPQPKPVDVKPVEPEIAPVRVVPDRQNVTFNPDRAESKPVEKPVAVQQPKPQKKITPSVTKPKKTVAATNGGVYVQFGSYSTRELAQAAEHKIRAAHQNLFTGKQFVILAAEVNGKTTYRLRVAFTSTNDANGFCRNAKSDGLDCYVTK